MTAATLDSRKNRTAIFAFLGALGMLGLGFAAVPLYQMFCQVTGFGGTTQRASESDAALAERMGASAGAKTISIRFDGTTANDVPWSFRPEQVTDTVTITGTATFNVEPEQAGAYFNKIQCFCFTEQVLKPGQEVRMPVLYYVDPKALDDPNMDDVEQITLSYTFHRALESAE